MKGLTHFDKEGKARMVDVTSKPVTAREATAKGKVMMNRETFRLIRSGAVGKGDVLGVARTAGIMAAKRTAGLIPLCHPLPISSAEVEFSLNARHNSISITSRVKTTGRTGVEMEALTAVAVSALTIYDMCKSVDKGMVISDILLYEKRGGKSGTYRRKR